jgi:excisionase family DNA binding protein
MEPLVVKPEDASHLLGVSRATVYRLIATGELPSLRVGSDRRVSVETLRRWLAEREESQKCESPC